MVGEEDLLEQQAQVRIGVWPDVALLGDGHVLDELGPWVDEGADGGHVEVVIERGHGVGGGETRVWLAGIQD